MRLGLALATLIVIKGAVLRWLVDLSETLDPRARTGASLSAKSVHACPAPCGGYAAFLYGNQTSLAARDLERLNRLSVVALHPAGLAEPGLEFRRRGENTCLLAGVSPHSLPYSSCTDPPSERLVNHNRCSSPQEKMSENDVIGEIPLARSDEIAAVEFLEKQR